MPADPSHGAGADPGAVSGWLAPTVAAMGEALTATPVAHADETGMRMGGKPYWLHVLVTPLLTWLGAAKPRITEQKGQQVVLPGQV